MLVRRAGCGRGIGVVPLRAALVSLAVAVVAGCAGWGRQEPAEDIPSAPTEPVPAPGATVEPPPPRSPPSAPPIAALDAAHAEVVLLEHRHVPGRTLAALAPGEIGYYLDVLVARLRQHFGATGLVLERDVERVRLVLPPSAAYEHGSVRPGPELLGWLQRLHGVLAPFEQTLVSVHGHTDGSGEAAVNRRLSLERARAAAEVLAGLGISRSRLVVFGHGADRPVAADDTPQGRARNRRVEVWIDPLLRE